MQGFYELWKSSLRQQDPERADVILSAVDSFEKDAGISIENDILSWMGNEVAFLISDVDLQGLFPFPKLALMVKVKDEAKAESSMKKLVDVVVKKAVPPGVTEAAEGEEAPPSPIKTSEESYSGTTMQSLEITLPYQSLSPAYTVMDDTLIIGTSKETLKNLIDTKTGKADSITSDSSYKAVSKSFPKKSQSDWIF